MLERITNQVNKSSLNSQLVLSEVLYFKMKNTKHSLILLTFITLMCSANSFPQGIAENDNSQMQPATGSLNFTKVNNAHIMVGAKSLGESLHENVVNFNFVTLATKISASNFSFGSHYFVTKGQKLNNLNASCAGPTCSVTAIATRKGSKEVVNALKRHIGEAAFSYAIGLNTHTEAPGKLNFAFSATLLIDFGEPYNERVDFPIFLGQGHDSFGNNWWLFPGKEPLDRYVHKPFMPDIFPSSTKDGNFHRSKTLSILDHERRYCIVLGDPGHSKSHEFFVLSPF